MHWSFQQTKRQRNRGQQRPANEYPPRSRSWSPLRTFIKIQAWSFLLSHFHTKVLSISPSESAAGASSWESSVLPDGVQKVGTLWRSERTKLGFTVREPSRYWVNRNVPQKNHVSVCGSDYIESLRKATSHPKPHLASEGYREVTTHKQDTYFFHFNFG